MKRRGQDKKSFASRESEQINSGLFERSIYSSFKKPYK